MLASLSGTIIVVNALYLVLRLADLVISGKTLLMFTSGVYSVMFWIEIAAFAAPIVMFASPRRRARFSTMFQASILLVLSGALYRFDTYLVAYNPGPNWTYFPNLPELIITLGAIAFEIALYVYIVKRFPILAGVPAARSAQ
jgi:Ni/Fe-hydrogenase subunit HybB-like protein